ncbi:MAG: hypothetical protein AAF570_00500, partial [Bacteroidota bacterium]
MLLYFPQKLGTICLCCFALLSVRLSAQTTNISGVINGYAEVTAFHGCQNQISVDNSAPFSPGDIAYILQMQGANVATANNAGFGAITALNSAGLFERQIVLAVMGNDIYFTTNLVNTYQIAGAVQIVRVPQYTDALVTATLTCPAWNGSTGGVLAFEATGTVTLNANIDVSATGFRGGSNVEACPNGCNWFQNHTNYSYTSTDYRGANKGEGVAGNAPANMQRGRGAWSNGGGGGNDHNAGGGGGSNATAGGQGSRNNEPGTFNCDSSAPGVGGQTLTYTAAHVFLGGGGGAGHGNNSAGAGCNGGGGSSGGGQGGGIALLSAFTFNGNGQSILANGEDALAGIGDGAGGGGAGGTVVLNTAVYAPTAFTISATGGDGGDANAAFQNRCFGPGGGGSGGV